MMRAAIVVLMCVASCAPPRDVPLGAMAPMGAPGEPSAVNAGEWSFLGYEGIRLRSRSWDIRTTVTDPALLNRLPSTLETALASMRAWLATDEALPESREVMITWLLGDRRQWVNLTRVLQPQHAANMETLGRGGFSVRGVAVLYDIDRRRHYRDTLSLALHEGWHQYMQTAFATPLPPWLDEGLATQMEGHALGSSADSPSPPDNPQRRRRAWWMLRQNRMRSLADFISDDPHAALARGQQSLLDYYAQAWAATGFLLERDDTGPVLRRFIAESARGVRSKRTLDALDLASLDEAFTRWCLDTLAPTWRR